jgi:hypothetical protein
VDGQVLQALGDRHGSVVELLGGGAGAEVAEEIDDAAADVEITLVQLPHAADEDVDPVVVAVVSQRHRSTC